MRDELGPGPATMNGLRWLAGVGPASTEAWGVAMGWNRSTTYRHAARLIKAGWAARQSTVRGGGALIYVTREGVSVSGVVAVALAAAPAPTTWAHCDACGWVAAWLTARGRELTGPRELLASDAWHGMVRWSERGSARSRGHRPDLIARLQSGGAPMPIEVELATKSSARLNAILTLHARWITAGQARGLIYVCETSHLADRVATEARALGLSDQAGNFRVELLQTIKNQAVDHPAKNGNSVGKVVA
jgi:hypothetical protein